MALAALTLLPLRQRRSLHSRRLASCTSTSTPHGTCPRSESPTQHLCQHPSTVFCKSEGTPTHKPTPQAPDLQLLDRKAVTVTAYAGQ